MPRSSSRGLVQGQQDIPLNETGEQLHFSGEVRDSFLTYMYNYNVEITLCFAMTSWRKDIVMTKEEKVTKIMERLYKVYPQPETDLHFENPLQLLVATIMAAQCTDKLVNKVCETLFKKYKTANDFATRSVEEIGNDIKPVTFWTNKGKMLHNMGVMLVEQHNGEVPQTMEELVALPGVARKTANVVLGNAFGMNEGIVIDTHMIRLSQKLGLTDQKDPVKIEKDLMQIVPQEKYTDFANLLILHGRYFCTARPHTCQDCPLLDLCPDKIA